jgi:hypothetical protein
MFASEGFVQAAPQFPERVTIHVPRGMGAALKRSAKREGTSVSDLMRRSISMLVEVSEDSPNAPSSPQSNRAGSR